MTDISGDQVAVYDRQLRLWGVQAQQRLLKAKVLLWGLQGCNVEVCKNLVLAGVSLVMRDHRETGAADVAFDYFLREEDIGRNRAECAARRVQEMNPFCAVSASSEAFGNVTDAKTLQETLRGYDVVCLALGVVGFDISKASTVDAACRANGAAFVLTATAGELAFFFSDLGTHTVHEHSGAQGGVGSTAAAVQAPAETETLEFPSFEEWLNCPPDALQQQKADASFLLFSCFASFLRSGGEAVPSAAEKFQDYCGTVAKCTPKVDGFADLKDAFPLFFVEPLMHVASVLAGLLAQEVIKAITKRNTPLINCVCFNAHTSVALVEQIPARPPAPKKRKAETEEVSDID